MHERKYQLEAAELPFARSVGNGQISLVRSVQPTANRKNIAKSLQIGTKPDWTNT